MVGSQPEYVLDAFGQELRKGTLVVYAGRDEKDRITFNRGLVSQLEAERVQVFRTERSTNSGLEKGASAQRRVWVELWKVAKAL